MSEDSGSFAKVCIQHDSPNTSVKLEPLDIPLSPTEMFSEEDNNEDGNECDMSSDFGQLMSIHEDDDPGGDDEPDSADREDINYHDSGDMQDSEDQMEFVPTDFLDQEQDIVEEKDVLCNLDGKEKTDENENEEEEDEEEEDDDAPEEQPSPSTRKHDAHKGGGGGGT